MDIAFAKGGEVNAAASGTVLFAGVKNGYGNTVVIDHGGGYYSLYAHKAGLVNDCDTDYYNLVDFDEAKKKELLEFRLRYNKRGYTSFCEKCAGFSVINKNYYYPAIQSHERGYVNEVDK